MDKLLIKNLETIYTFNDEEAVYHNSDILIEGPAITKIQENITIEEGMKVIDGANLVALPGFVNTHHHLYQTMFRGIKEVQEMPLFPWLKGLYEFWKHLTDETVYYGAMVGFSELLRTGCTFTADHHYVFPRQAKKDLIDTQIKAGEEIGIRFHATRGSMSRGVDDGGLPPQSVVQKEWEIMEDSERLIKKYHNTDRFSMTQVALAPCSPFSVTEKLMVESREMATKYGVMLHTHLAETLDEERFCLETYGKRPYEVMDDMGWIGPDVWFAHGIYFNDHEIKNLRGSGIAHCPSSNMKLNSGICRTSELFNAGAKLSIAVDGSASNDGSNMWEEAKRAYLLNHLKYGTEGLNAYNILKVATRGGAEVLGRTDVGYLNPQVAADIVLYDLSGIEYAGCHDPLVSIVSLGNSSLVNRTIVNGKVVVEKGRLLTINENEMGLKARTLAKKHVEEERKNS